MAENKSIVTYADVVRFYADKKGGCIEDVNDDYYKVFNALKEPKKINRSSFDDYITDVNNNIKPREIKRFDESVIFTKERNNRYENEDYYIIDNMKYYLTNAILGVRYFVPRKEDKEDKAGDAFFVGLILFYEKLGISSNEYCVVNEYNKSEPDFMSWFKGEKTANQKWHLFQFLLYKELNYRYNFSYVKKIENIFDKADEINIIKDPELLVWMAKTAGVNDEVIEKFKSNTLDNEDIKRKIIERIKKWKNGRNNNA